MKRLILFVIAGITFFQIDTTLILAGTLPASGYPVRIETDKSSYPIRAGDSVNLTIKTKGASERQPLLGVKLTLSPWPDFLEKPTVTSMNGVGSANINQSGDALIILLYGMRITGESDLALMKFSVKGEPRTTSINTVYESGSLKVSEISGTDEQDDSGQSYKTYPLPAAEFIRLTVGNPSASANFAFLEKGDRYDYNAPGGVVKTETSISDISGNIAKGLFSFAAGLTGIYLVYGGASYAMAAGDEEKILKARKSMIYAVIGLVISLTAYLITNLVVSFF